MNKVPKLRFKEFSGDWEEKRLKEVSSIYDGTHQTPNYVENGIKFVSVEDIKNIENTQKYISEEDFNKNFKIKPQINDILMTRITAGIIGDTSIIKNNNPLGYYVSLALIRKKDNLEVNFLNQYINSRFFKLELNKRIIHVAFPKKINLGDIGECKINLPSLQEQEKIGNFLSNIDKKISITEEKLELFKEYKKGIMQKIFNQKLRFKDSNGNDYPEWEEKEVGELLVESKILPEKQELEKRITVKLNLKGIEKRKITPEEKEGATTNYLRKEGQFIYGKQNFHKGAFGIIPKELDGYQSSSDIPSFDFIRNLIIGKYFYYYFSQKNVYENLENISTGTGSKRIQPKVFFNVKLDIPCLEEQQKIANFLSSIDNKIDNLATELEDLKEFKKGLLQQMFI